MVTPTDQYTNNGNRSDGPSAVWQAVMGIVRRLVGFFILAEEDQLKAGIYLGGEGRDG